MHKTVKKWDANTVGQKTEPVIVVGDRRCMTGVFPECPTRVPLVLDSMKVRPTLGDKYINFLRVPS